MNNVAEWNIDQDYTEAEEDADRQFTESDAVDSQAGDEEFVGSEEDQTGLGGQSATAVQDIMLRAQLSS